MRTPKEKSSPSPVVTTKTEKIDFIKLRPILDILSACIWTGRVAREKPVSVLLVAEQESAKTEALKFFRGTDTLQYLSDITSRGLEAYQSDIERGRIRHLVILDVVRIVNHGKGVSDRLIQTLSSLMEEGEAETSDAGSRRKWNGFPNIGCLMSITPKYFSAKAGNWRKTGFLSRFLTVRFKYSKETVHEIHTAIRLGHKLPEPVKEDLPEFPACVQMSEDHARTLSTKAEFLGKSNNLYGFRYHRCLRALAMGNALKDGRSTVNDTDVMQVLQWSDFFADKEIEL